MNMDGLHTRYEATTEIYEEIAAAPREEATEIMQKIYSAPQRPELIAKIVEQGKKGGGSAAVSFVPQTAKRMAPVAVEAGADMVVVQGTVVTARHSSKSLSSIIKTMNKWSNNFISEQILKTLGAELFGLPGTSKKGLKAVRNYLFSIGISKNSFEIYDGSGLSRMNRITPYAMVKVLAHAFHDHRFSSDFISSLPIYGIDGTLRKRRRLTKDEYRVRAKTGYLNGVSSLSGYVFSRNGEILGFSILINGNGCKGKRLAREVTKYLQLFDRSLHKKGKSIVLNIKKRKKILKTLIKNNFNKWHRTYKPRLY